MSESSQTLALLSQVCSAFFDRLDRRSLIARILDTAIQLTQGDRGTIFLAPLEAAQLEGSELSSLIATGLEGREIRVSINDGVAGHVFRTSLPLLTNDAQHDLRFYPRIDEATGYVTQSILSVPLRTPGGKTLGVLEILNSKKGGFEQDELRVLEVLALFASIALEYRETIDTLNETTESIRQNRRSWAQQIERIPLKSENQALQELYDKLPSFAQSDSSILIEGESGTGKEVVAQAVHVRSNRRERPFVAINCAAIPESLFEAELFGVARGAATGTAARKGKIELSHGGTLFLDEIGELPLSMQAKLLRVLQERSVTRVGSEEKPKSVDFRLIAATNKNLASSVREGKFREDLFYRLNVVHFRLFPLRERTQDIPGLCAEILGRFVFERGWRTKTISNAAMEQLLRCAWPGNIRQLQNKLESAMIHSGHRMILEPEDFQFEVDSSASQTASNVIPLDLRTAKESLEKELIQRALQQTDGNKTQAAKLLGITREGLRKAMKKAA